MSNAGKNLTLLASVLLLSLLLCEVAFRLMNGVSPFALTNFREAGAIKVNLNNAVRYDGQLGWVHRENLDFGGFQTEEYGIRRHSPEQIRVRKGAILVSGSSFTAGSDVRNAETWPAQLEQVLGRPVENAATGGWGIDQVILRAEQLLPVIEPEAIVIDLMESTVQWVGYSVLTMPKPYFTLAGGQLIEHNVPVPRVLPAALLERAGWLKSIGGYSLIIDRVMSTVDTNTWHGKPGTVDRIQNDQIDVTCALLQRLKRKAEERNIRVVLVSLFSGEQITEAEHPPPTVLLVEKCARAMGFDVVSIFDRMRALYLEDANNMEALYGRYKSYYNRFAHFTPRGNREVAIAIAGALNADPAKGMASDYRAPTFVPGDGRNFFPRSEALEHRLFGTNGALFRKLAKPIEGEPQEFQIIAEGAKGEHFASLMPVKIEGPITLSLEVRLEGSEMFGVQLMASDTSGILADFDLRREQSSTLAIGELAVRNLEAQVIPLRDGWYRISVGARFPLASLSVILRLKDPAGVANFRPNDEAMLFRRLQLERGQSASPYVATSRPASPGFIKGDGINLVKNSESLKQVEVSASAFDAVGGTVTPRIYRLAATGGDGEHFAGVRGLPTTTGPYTASVQVRKGSGARFRLQLREERRANGVIGDFDLETRSVSVIEMGRSRKCDATIEEDEDGWLKLSVTATLDGPARIILQLLDRQGSFAFAAGGEALEIRGIQVERGQSASPYVATSGPASPGFIRGDGINLVNNSESLKQVGVLASAFDAVDGTAAPTVYRLAATGRDGEHFAGVGGLATTTGPYTASVQVRKAAGVGFRLELREERRANGVIGDFDLETRSISVIEMGTSRKSDASIEEVGDGWLRVSVTATLDASAQIILQLLDRRGSFAFAPAGEALEMRGIQVEHGQSASPYGLPPTNRADAENTRGTGVQASGSQPQQR